MSEFKPKAIQIGHFCMGRTSVPRGEFISVEISVLYLRPFDCLLAFTLPSTNLDVSKLIIV